VVKRKAMKHKPITHLKDLHADPRNARLHDKRNIGMIEQSLEQYGAARSIVIDETGQIIAGHGVLEGAANVGIEKVISVEATGNEIVAVVRRGLTPKQKAELAIADNRASDLSEMDPAMLKSLSDEGLADLDKFFFPEELTALFANALTEGDAEHITPEEAHKTLAERFIVPPFSVLDARQGYWKDRKRAWLALGIQSELGRRETNCPGSPGDKRGPEWKHFAGDKQTNKAKPSRAEHYSEAANSATRLTPRTPSESGLQRERERENISLQEPRAAKRISASPGGSPRPAADYSKRQRGDGRGRPIDG